MKTSFIPNVGQAGSAVRFVAHAADGTILLAPGEIALQPRGVTRTSLRIVFEGASGRCTLAGADALPGKVNYLLGDDPSRWRKNVSTYGRVVYRELYAGVALDLTGDDGALKGTYAVAAGADPNVIRWRYSGAHRVSVARSGDLEVSLGGRELVEAAPVAWQDAGGRRRPVNVSYSVDEGGSVRFAIGTYDRSQPLVIDPHLVYSTLIGGSEYDEGRDVAVDAAGNAYVTGTTRSADFPAAGAPDATYSGPFTPSNFGDAFIAKLNASGSALLWMTYLGGAHEDIADAIAVDPAGNVYVTGMTRSSNFPVVSAVQPTAGGQSCATSPCSDAFVTKLNAAGNALVFSTYLGGDKNENSGLLDTGTRSTALGIAVDEYGNVYVTGVTESDDFPTPGGAATTRAGSSDAFLAKVRFDGTSVLYGSYLGGAGAEYSGDVAVDAFGRAYLTGATLSSDFPVKNAMQASSGGLVDAFVARFDTFATGAASLQYATYLGGGGADYGMAIAVGDSAGPTVAGHTLSLDFPTVNAFQESNASAGKAVPRDGFVARLNAGGGALTYSTYLGGSEADVGYAMDLNAAGQALVTGRTFSDDFPIRDAWQTSRYASSDLFVARIDPTASGSASLLYSTYLGGNSADYGYGIAVDAGSNAYVTGFTSGVSGDTFPIYKTLGPNGTSSAVLVAKLDPRLQYWIPVASHAPGAKGSQWRTDLAAENGSGAAAALTMRLAAGGKTYSLTATVAKDAQSVFTDVVGQLGFSGSGAIEALSERPLRLFSRTYNLIAGDATCYPNGTFGQDYESTRAEAGLLDGETAWLTQLVETADYRTNIIVTNTGRRPATVTIAQYDGAGTFLTSFSLGLAAGEMKVDTQPFRKRAGQTNLQRGYAKVFVDSGYGVTATASVIDNLTNDPTTIAMIRTGAELGHFWIPVSSHAAGAKGSQWRTDLGLLNPSSLPANVTLTFRAGGGEFVNTTAVAPYSQAIVEDVVGQLPATGTGSLEILSDRGLLATSRTYNQIAAGATCFPEGTLGQSYAASASAWGLVAGETAWLVQLQETAASRTNISLTNTGVTSASVTVSLFAGTGQLLASYTVSLAAGEMKQENRPFATRAGRTNLASGYARVVVNAGAGVLATASVVDNITNDATTVAPQY